jgi:hypothetical protein
MYFFATAQGASGDWDWSKGGSGPGHDGDGCFFVQRWEENKSRIHGFIVFIYVVLFVIFIVWCFFFLCLA